MQNSAKIRKWLRFISTDCGLETRHGNRVLVRDGDTLASTSRSSSFTRYSHTCRIIKSDKKKKKNNTVLGKKNNFYFLIICFNCYPPFALFTQRAFVSLLAYVASLFWFPRFCSAALSSSDTNGSARSHFKIRKASGSFFFSLTKVCPSCHLKAHDSSAVLPRHDVPFHHHSKVSFSKSTASYIISCMNERRVF